MSNVNRLKYLRKKAAEAGYSIHKGFSHYHYNNAIVVYGGERETGYNVVDEATGLLEWGCYDNVRDHIWQLEDVENFLREAYEEAGLMF